MSVALFLIAVELVVIVAMVYALCRREKAKDKPTVETPLPPITYGYCPKTRRPVRKT